MAATQMNTRIDEELKRRGDEVIARHGLTPSQVVRAVWEHIGEIDDLPEFMRIPDAEAIEAERQRKVKLVEEGAHIWENFFKDHGLAVPAPREFETDAERTAYYDELRFEAYEERARERGLV